MLIRRAVRWEEERIEERNKLVAKNSNVIRAKRDIYIESVPTLHVSEEMRDFVSSHISVTVVNRSLIRGGLMMPGNEDAEWTYLKSIYIFQTYVGPERDPIRNFRELILYPQTEMTTGYTSKQKVIHDLGMSIIDLDVMSYRMFLTDYVRLKAIDPRFYSDLDHHNALFMFPEDFLTVPNYKGEDLTDENTRFYMGQPPLGETFMRDTGEHSDLPTIVDYTQIMSWRSMYLQDASLSLFHPASVGAIDSLVAMYDSKDGLTIKKMQTPKFIPDAFAKRKANEFVQNLKRVGDKITKNLGDIRLFYSTGDQQDYLKVLYHDKENAPIGKDYTTMTVSRSDVLDHYLVQSRCIR